MRSGYTFASKKIYYIKSSCESEGADQTANAQSDLGLLFFSLILRLLCLNSSSYKMCVFQLSSVFAKRLDLKHHCLVRISHCNFRLKKTRLSDTNAFRYTSQKIASSRSTFKLT